MYASIIAAATENYDYCENDDPGAVVVEKMAQAVVVHKMYVPPKVFRAFCCAHLYLMLATRFVTLYRVC